MVTNSSGAELLNTIPLLRVGLDRDVVVYLPAYELGYKHMGQKLEFDSYNYRFLTTPLEIIYPGLHLNNANH